MYDLTPETTEQAVRIIESWASVQWKVLGHHFTREDMIQEGYIVLDRVVTRYAKSRTENHLLSTLATSLQNRSNDLSRRPDRDATETDLGGDEGLQFMEPDVEDRHDGDYPDWLVALLDFVQGATPRQLQAIQGPGGDEYLASKCNLPSGMPLRRMVTEALGAA
jgi:hypothetical protein